MTSGHLTGYYDGTTLSGVSPATSPIATIASNPPNDWLGHWESETVFVPAGQCSDAPSGRFLTIVRDSDSRTAPDGISIFYTNAEGLGKERTRSAMGAITNLTNSLASYGVDPSIAWAGGNRLYAAIQAGPANHNKRDWGGARILRSDDCGVTWVEDSVVPGRLSALFSSEDYMKACDTSEFTANDGCSPATGDPPGYSKKYTCWCDVTPDMFQLFVDPYDRSQWAIADFRTDANHAWRDGLQGRTGGYTYRACTANCATAPEYGDWDLAGAFVEGPYKLAHPSDSNHHNRIFIRSTVSVPRGTLRGAASGGALVVVGVDEADESKVKLYLTLDRGATVFSETISDPGYNYNHELDLGIAFKSIPLALGAAQGDLDSNGNPTVMVAWKTYASQSDRRAALVMRRVHINMQDPSRIEFRLDPQIVRLPSADEGGILYLDLIGSDPRYSQLNEMFPNAMLVSYIRAVPDPKEVDTFVKNTKFRWKYVLLTGSEMDNRAIEEMSLVDDWIPNGWLARDASHTVTGHFLGEYYNGVSFVGAHDGQDTFSLRFLSVQPWSDNARYPSQWDDAGRTSLKYLQVRGPRPSDPCEGLKSYRLIINANGHEGTTDSYWPVGANRKLDGSYEFETLLKFQGEPADKMAGTCKRGHMQFKRMREGTFEQVFDGRIFEGNSHEMAGTFSQGGVGAWGWFGRMQHPLPR